MREHINHDSLISNARTVLTVEDIPEIRRMYEDGQYNLRDLAQIFDCSVGAIHAVVTRRTWRYV